MSSNKPEAVIAGHICLDVIPAIRTGKAWRQLFVPGQLTEVDGVTITTGGTVANTGVVLHRLGIRTSLMGKVGDDEFGRLIMDSLRKVEPGLTAEMIVAPNERSSYTVVLSIPGKDRIFLHCPGANDTFQAADIRMERIAEARLFHFGYPPLMKQMYRDDGSELVNLLRRVKQLGVTTSMDMATLDPDSAAGRADWVTILERALPHVDVFMPSLEETLSMLKHPYEQQLRQNSEPGAVQPVPESVLGELADQLLEMGCAIVALKLGSSGLYLRTGKQARLARLGPRVAAADDAWAERELWVPCFKTTVRGTTGAGDCTIAGFLAALLKGHRPEAALHCAVAAGAYSVEAADATSGIVSWSEVERRVQDKGERLALPHMPVHWKWNNRLDIWSGPRDALLS